MKPFAVPGRWRPMTPHRRFDVLDIPAAAKLYSREPNSRLQLLPSKV
jgi:hypothetical protein